MPTRPRRHARGRRDRGDSSGTPLIWIASAREATTLANRDGIAERGRVGGSRPRSAERGKGKATTAAAGRVGCAATYRDLLALVYGPGALLDHRTAAMPGRFEERSSWPGGPGCVPRNAGKGRRLPAPAPGPGRSRPVDTAGVCGWRAVPGPRRRWSRTSRGLPRVSARPRRPRCCGGGRVGGTTGYCGRLGGRSRRGRTPVPDETAPAGCHSTGCGPVSRVAG
jgi:hypothetical protein